MIHDSIHVQILVLSIVKIWTALVLEFDYQLNQTLVLGGVTINHFFQLCKLEMQRCTLSKHVYGEVLLFQTRSLSFSGFYVQQGLKEPSEISRKGNI